MRLIQAFLYLALLVAAPIFAAPAKGKPAVNTAPTTVTCKPTKNLSTTKTFKVNIARAKEQMQKAGLNTGTSGDPHVYGNVDKLHWGVGACDKPSAHLLEYPVYWDGEKVEWKKNEYTLMQGKTPIRVVYANANGVPVYCGVMTHSKVTDEHKGEEFFVKCE